MEAICQAGGLGREKLRPVKDRKKKKKIKGHVGV
jgi:hypothetical protein